MSSQGADDPSTFDSFLREVAELGEVAPPAAEPDRTGQLLGHFRIRHKLGQGGMGIVYAADDVRLRRRVALKVLPLSLVTNDDRRRRFLREARSASAVLHPNLATVFDVGEADGTVFIAMEQVEGRTLRRLLDEQGGELPVGEALRIVREAARGLARAHAAGVVHRDLKPENLMIADDGSVKVLDFGLAKLPHTPEILGGDDALDDDLASRAGRILGTPAYMSPEQARGAAVDARSDVFSLGVVMYEMVSGTRPFRGDATGELLEAVERDEPVFTKAVPDSLRALLVRCMRKNPEERWSDCGELARELEHISLTKRRPWLLVAGVLAVGTIAVVWAMSGEAQQAETFAVRAPELVSAPPPTPSAQAASASSPPEPSAPKPRKAKRTVIDPLEHQQ